MRGKLISSIFLSALIVLVSFPNEAWSSEEAKKLPGNNQVQFEQCHTGLGSILLAENTQTQFEKGILDLDSILLARSSPAQNDQVQNDQVQNDQAYFEQWHIGFDTAFIGKVTRDYRGVPQRVIGMSVGIGIAYRQHFRQAPQLRGLHPYWEIGTMALILPYGGVGIKHSWPLGNCEIGKDGVLSAGIGAYLIFLTPAPMFNLSVTF
ncbi:hypothetical protein M1N66_04725 [Thermodesulfovibrionales bacterium]|nr:hypothetical protein [Thermodesulfovibrionales bacterium]